MSTVTASSLSWIIEELEVLEERGLVRHPVALSTGQGPEVVVEGRKLLMFCSNNYLDLATDRRVVAAASAAALQWGAGAGASRLLGGTTDLHVALEHALAQYKGCEDAILFSSGYLANVGTIAALAGEDDAVFSDELNHASIIDGCRLSGATRAIYRHADPNHLDELLAKTRARRRLVVTDSLFSMDGDLAPLEDLAEVCERHEAMLMVDEAHATGLIGQKGSGVVELTGTGDRVDVVMGTLSKALGSAGGFVAGRKELITWLRNRARTYIFDTALPVASVAAAAEALRIANIEPERRLTALLSARLLDGGLTRLGFRITSPVSPIVPIYVGEVADAMALSERLLEEGIFVPAIRPPSVPPGTARLRITTTAGHGEEHLDRLLTALAETKGQVTHDVPLGPARRRQLIEENPEFKSEFAGYVMHPSISENGGVFVTGTDTGVGKTLVAALLARTLAASGMRVGAMKPAQTGVAEGDDDMGFIAAVGGVPFDRTSVPYAFEEPLAPAVAAYRAGESVEIGRLAQSFFDLRSRTDAVVVEGAGGLLVPLADGFTMADFARAMELPVVVVARPGLGTINHAAMTIEVARARGLLVLGVVLSGFPSEPNVAEATNPLEIELAANTEILGVVPHLPGLASGPAAAAEYLRGADVGAWLAPTLGGSFDREVFLAELLTRR